MTSSPRLDGDGEGLSDELVERTARALSRCATSRGYRLYDERTVLASAALVAAGVPDLIAERDRERMFADDLAKRADELTPWLLRYRMAAINSGHGPMADEPDWLVQLGAHQLPTTIGD